MSRMKIILIGLGIVLALLAVRASLQRMAGEPPGPSESGSHLKSEKIGYYTCPMHPHIHERHPGSCPICSMKLVPVYAEGASPPPGAESQPAGPQPAGPHGVLISPERQQRIGITTGTVVKKALTKEIRTAGRVAFDPDLAVAQTEFVEIARGVPTLKAAATQRLRLLGMADDEIRQLEKRGAPDPALMLPDVGGPVWVYAPIYEQETPFVKVGTTATVTLPNSESVEGVVRGIEPVIDPITRSVRARIEVPGGGGKIQPGGYLNVSIQVDLGEQITAPKSSVIDTGARQIVFVIHEGQRFEAREVKLGPEAKEDRVILSGLNEGETVATSAAFLIDSESQLKAAVSGTATAPTCPEGQHWDAGMSMCMPGTGG